MRRKYNSLKRHALAVFEHRGWLSPAAWAVLAKVYPVRSAYSYLKHLHRWKLLDRALDRRGLLLYRLSARGAERLAWLRRQHVARRVTPMVRAALYARVSTHAGQDPEMQLLELRDYCHRRAWESAGEYVDIGVSGSRERRPRLDQLLADCRRRRIDAVVVYRYDRFARSLRQLVNALSEFDALGIQFVSLHEGVDTSTPNGRLVFGIFASLAEFERQLIRERVRSGLAAARARGARLGRPRRYVDASRVSDLRARGQSWREIGRELGVAVATARDALQRRSENLATQVVEKPRKSRRDVRSATCSKNKCFRKVIRTTPRFPRQ